MPDEYQPAPARGGVRVYDCERLILAAMPRGVEMTHREVKASVPGLENATLHAIGTAFSNMENAGQCERAYRNSTYYVTLTAGLEPGAAMSGQPDEKVTASQIADPADEFLTAAEERWDTAENARWQDYPTALEHLSKALRSTADVPVLLRAVRAALARHQPAPAVRLVPCSQHERWRGSLCGVPEFGQEFETENLRVRRACPDCRVFDEPYCRHCLDDDGRFQDWPCEEWHDITDELTGANDA